MGGKIKMSLFSKSSTDYIMQVIYLANQVQISINDNNISRAKKLLKLILKFDIKEFNKIVIHCLTPIPYFFRI